MAGAGLVASVAYQPEPTAAAAARRFVRDTLGAWVTTSTSSGDGHGLIDDAVLLTSELVTNAVVHAGTPVQVTCRLVDGGVEVTVSDAQPGVVIPEPPPDGRVPVERTSGRGLLLPSALATAWGVTYGRSAKAVWFRLGLASPAGGGAWVAGGPDGALLGPAAVAAILPGAGSPPWSALSGGPVHSEPGHSEPVHSGPVHSGPVHSGPVHSEPVHSGPVHSEAGYSDPGYSELLAATVGSARASVAADAAYALMAGEDGDLCLRAAVGTVPSAAGADGSTSVVTVPFVVDGRVTGLLAAVSGPDRRYGDDEAMRLQVLADQWGPGLERARLHDLDQVRRRRIGALADARELLSGRLSRQEILSLAERVAVPRLVPWCAVLLREGRDLRTACARHQDEGLSSALTWLLDQVSGQMAAGTPAPCPPGRYPRPWRWPLAVPATAGRPGAGAGRSGGTGRPPGRGRSGGTGRPPGRGRSGGTGGTAGVPDGAGELSAGVAWCFPLGPEAQPGVLVAGPGQDGRLSREVTELLSDLACRIGLALPSGPLTGQR